MAQLVTPTREATAYLQIAGRPPGPGQQYDGGGRATVLAATTQRPDRIRPGCIVVKVRLRIPQAAWEPFSPEAVIDIPADLTDRGPIEVEAVDPS